MINLQIGYIDKLSNWTFLRSEATDVITFRKYTNQENEIDSPSGYQ